MNTKNTGGYVPSSAAAIFVVATSSGVTLHSGLDTVMLVSKYEKTKSKLKHKVKA